MQVTSQIMIINRQVYVKFNNTLDSPTLIITFRQDDNYSLLRCFQGVISLLPTRWQAMLQTTDYRVVYLPMRDEVGDIDEAGEGVKVRDYWYNGLLRRFA